MKRFPSPLLLVVATLLVALSPTPAGAQAADASGDSPFLTRSGWQPLGLVRVRDLTPFGILRLDMLPTHAVAAPPGTWALEANLSWQNTYVLSDNVERYLRSRGGGRAPLSAGDVDAILGLPGDAYFVDGEFGLLDLSLHHWVNERWSLYATVPWYEFDGGFLDRVIEDFHAEFGFSTAGRDLVRRDRFQVVADVGGVRFVLPQAPESGFGDPVFGARYSVNPGGARWNLVLEAAAKVPLGDAERLASTGNADYGMQATWQRFFSRGALYLSLSGVLYDEPIELPESETFIPTAIAGYEHRLSQRSSAIVQLYASPSVIRDSTAEELTETKYQLTVGLQTWRGRTAFRLGITENLSNFSNTPDIGITLQVGRVLRVGR